MNGVKKLSIVFIIIMLITCMIMSKTYAALSCNVNLSASKDKVTNEEQFSVNVAISNLQTTKGIIAIGAVIDYDKDSLTLVDIEGQNKWSDPFYNSSNGKITSLKNELSTKNENVFKITFEVKEKGKTKNNAWIKISDFEISDGDGEKNCGGSTVNIAIEEKDSTNSGNNNQGNNNQGDNNQGDNNQGNSNQGNNNQGNNNQGNNNTQKPNTKPSTGTNKPTSNGSTNAQGGNTNNESTSNNNNDIETNIIGNVVENNVINNENEANNMQNIFENNIEQTKENKTTNKGLFYIIGIVAVFIIIGILFVITKYWKVN